MRGGIDLDIKKEIRENHEVLIKLRRDFHKHPETGFKEFRTSAIIADFLYTHGLEVKRGIAETGVSGLLRGGEDGKTLLLRSDMDALPVTEDTGLPFSSVNKGVMHACGHDGHMSMLLVAAMILSRHRKEFRGNIKFIFQPNEEEAGAERMINEGVLTDPTVDAAMGIHLWSPLSTGVIGINSGPMMAASHYFYLTVKGKGGHAGIPHKARDPVSAAARIIDNVQQFQTRELDTIEEPTVIIFTAIHGGSAPTVIPPEISLQGSIRFLHKRGEFVQRRFEEIISHTCALTGTDYELDIVIGNRLLSNDEEMTGLVLREAEQAAGTENIQKNMKMMVGEDFAEFSRKVKSAFYFVGTGNSEKGTNYSHHHPSFNIDEDSLPLGVEMHIRTALAYLGS